MDREKISQQFKHFALNECRGSSELYEYLALQIAEDDKLLEMARNTKHGQPIPNLFFASVHYLLLKGSKHALKDYYASMTENPKEVKQAFSYFRDFCFIHKNDIIAILKNKLVQTNEVRRCAYLYPSFCYIYNKVKTPLSLIEIGTSAGLQLLWDQYAYSYGDNKKYGNTKSNVHITSEWSGEKKAILFKDSPPVITRIGIDLHINNLKNPDDYLWLRSLIWPEHKQRVKMFERAANHLKEHHMTLLEGDGVKLLPDIIADIQEETTICLFHTHVANQIPTEDKYLLMNMIEKLGRSRNICHLYNNMWDAQLHLDSFIDGKEEREILAETDGHGRWFKWK